MINGGEVKKNWNKTAQKLNAKNGTNAIWIIVIRKYIV
jgi:hypothetical protein